MTQMQLARRRDITPEVLEVSSREGVPAERISRGVAEGRIVIPKNILRDGVPAIGIGSGLRVKVNANVGTSPDFTGVKDEIKKAEAALECGADTLMDLSIGGDIKGVRKALLKLLVPLGTVPIYEAGVVALKKRGGIVNMKESDIFKAIEGQAKEGVDFMTVHAGITLEGVEKSRERLTGIVSRGGSFLAAWMLHNSQENPLYCSFDYLLEVAGEYDITLSLGDALRPGSIHDATDKAQIHELTVLGELVERARRSGVQCMVEGPGHLPIDQIEANVILEKKICKGAPFYVLGPLVTDIAPGYDHITGAIGGAIAAMAGADFLCYVTPAEHLALPTVEDVKQGVIASKIAAHAADIASGIDVERDREMAEARANLDWAKQFKLCINPERAMEFRKDRRPVSPDVCTMCGEFCSMKLLKEKVEK
ncbi:MAG: phosphomethylpyrimidine synthase [Candidatus Hydrothermarchaeales archaeon]